MAPGTSEALLPSAEAPPVAALARHFLVLGCTAFGGPPVHLSMFQKRFVEEHKWLSSERFMELIAMANCLPGPSSTQVAFAIGIAQQGVKGGLVSGMMFVFPGLIIMTCLGFCFHLIKDEVVQPKSAANAVAISCSSVGVALVFAAVTGLVKKVAQGKLVGVICFGSAAACIITSPQPPWLNPALILLGGAICAVFPPNEDGQEKDLQPPGKTGLSTAAAVAIFVLYLGLAAWTIYDSAVDHGWLIPFLTAGMFVWGGGPVVLPMLMTVLTPTWIAQPIFLTGIALAEMMPGPVFNMSAFLGVQLALANGFPWVQGTLLAWLGLMGPGIVLTFGAMPLWNQLRSLKVYNHALPGLNAAAVGLLVSTVFTVFDALEARSPWPAGSRAIALCSYAAIEMVKADVPSIVVVAGLAGWLWSLTQHA